MAGLSVLLESKKGSGADARHVVSKFHVLAFRPPPPPAAAAAAAAAGSFSSSFLEYCYLCRRRIPESEDIYMYRGDRAFCSEECRSHQIFMDEEIVGKKKKGGGGGGGASCSAAAVAAPVAAPPPSRRRGRAAR